MSEPSPATTRSSWSITNRVKAALAVYCLIIIALAGVLSFIVREPQARIAMHDDLETRAVLGSNVISSMLDVYSSFMIYLATGAPESLDRLHANQATFRAALTTAAAGASDADDVALWSEVEQLSDAIRDNVIASGIARRQAFDRGEGDLESVFAIVADPASRERFFTLRSRVRAYVDEQQMLAHTTNIYLSDAATTLQVIYLIGSALLLLVGIGGAIYVIRAIAHPIQLMTIAAGRFAEGNLRDRLNWSRSDEIGALSSTMDHAATQIQLLIESQDAALRRIQTDQRILAAMLHSSLDGLMLISPDQRVVMLNEQMAEFVGRPRAELEGKTLTELISLIKHDIPIPVSALPRIAQMLAAPTGTSVSIAQDMPTRIEIIITTTPVGGAIGETLGTLVTIRDVTQEQQSARAKIEFVSMVSHELRTPLTSIKGYVDLLREGEVGDLTPEQLHFLAIVAASSDRLSALIDDLLDISAVDTGKLKLDRGYVDVNQLLRQIVTEFHPRFAARQQTLTLNAPEGLLPLRGDARRITQVIENLLSNAVKYTPDGGAITVGAAIDGPDVAITVRDTGIGMTPQEMEQVFQRFFRATNRTVIEAGGTGLGLNITRSLVELHGGTITVESTPGGGSTFTVRLPRIDPAVIHPPELSPRRTVVILSESGTINALCRGYFDRFDHRTLVGPLSAEGVALIRAKQPAIVVLGMVQILPAVDDMLTQIRQSSPGSEVLLVSCASFPLGRDERAAARAHGRDPADLAARVWHTLTYRPPLTVLLASDNIPSRQGIATVFRTFDYHVHESGAGMAMLAHPDLPAIDLAVIRNPDELGDRASWDLLTTIRADPRAATIPVVVMVLTRPGGVNYVVEDLSRLLVAFEGAR